MSTSPDLFHLDRGSKLPLYEQIARNLRALILSGRLEPGQAVPGEFDLAEMYGVNRLTVRRALDDLARQSWLVRRHGVGTFVTRPMIASIAASHLSFTRQMLAAGRQPSSQLVQQSLQPAAARIAHRLHLEEGEPLVEIVRLRLADGVPILLETASLPHKIFPGLESADLVTNSLYDLLAEQYGVIITRTDHSLKPILLSSEQARLLQVPPGSPSILTDIIGYTGDEPVEYTWSVANGEHSEFWFTFQRSDVTTSERSSV